jgi:mannitol/fructose-specific phosphotransferase system IIA component (Ntr-type)
VKVLRTDQPWAENERTIRETRFSRYPLVDPASTRPLGFVHVKDLYYGGGAAPDLPRLARPLVTVAPEDDLESLLGEFQRRRVHAAIVTAPDGGWAGMITLEDVIEEVVGTIEDEFETEPPWSVSAGLSVSRIVTGVKGVSIEEAVRRIVASVPAGALPRPAEEVTAKLLERERLMSTYLGAGLALPHARLEGLSEPAILLGRSEEGVPAGAPGERARLFFVLLTPSQVPRAQVRLLARIAGMMDSEFVRLRLGEARSAQDLLEAVKAGEAAALK